MRDRNERIVGVVNEGRRSFDLTNAVDQPIAIDLQDTGDVSKAVNAGARGSPAQDVIDEGAVDPRHLRDMGRCQAQLIGAGAQTVGQGMVLSHVVPSAMWIR